ncbi:hypothetical protein F5Y04DRAFT_286805 [Hypomontagnella monticulosa]|nr:hypothetical protein F5Y04DRAFT_286805 [Hypomontagnella monticulosa]
MEKRASPRTATVVTRPSVLRQGSEQLLSGLPQRKTCESIEGGRIRDTGLKPLRVNLRKWKPRSLTLTPSYSFVRARRTSPLDWAWYPSWLDGKVADLPQDIKELINEDQGLTAEELLYPIFSVIEKCLEKEQFDDVSIDEIIDHLIENQAITPDPESPGRSARHRQLVFAIIGWQTLLYQPAFNTCAPFQLAICEPGDEPDSKMVFDTYRVPIGLADRPLWVLLKGFGNLLPARSPETTRAASESSRAAVLWTPIYPREVNAYVLHNILRVRFRWVDSLALHLDYDKTSRTLSLFEFPSVCVKALQERGTIFAFASSGIDAVDPRADSEAIDSMLREVLVSYRLLFGQQAKTRRLFQRVWGSAEGQPLHHVDTLLPKMCTCTDVGWGIQDEIIPEDKEVYFAVRDFPVLYERIQLIVNELQTVRPKSMVDLLHDRRDKLQWWTFWLVSIFGTITVLLSIIQVVLQAVQVWQTFQH